ncbi:NAD(P)-dependent oxidoreductase [Amedibacillus sp. YH-ame6]
MRKIAIVNANSFARYYPEFITKLENEVGEVKRFTVGIHIQAKELAKELQGYSYLVVGTTPIFNEEFFKECPSIEYIARFGIGYNNVDVLGAKKYGVVASNIPGYLEKEDVAEQAIGLLMSLAKHTPDGNMAVHNDEWNTDRGRFLGTRLKGKKVGICGMGNIGSTFARIMKHGFECDVLAYDPYLNEDEIKARGAKKCELDELLSCSDVVSLHINLTKENYHMISKERLTKMKSTAYLINTARGELVDEVAVAKALEKGKLGGYGADVIEDEPIKMNHPLLEQKKAIITPHLGTYNYECNHQMCQSIVDDIIRVYHNEKPSVVLEK